MSKSSHSMSVRSVCLVALGAVTLALPVAAFASSDSATAVPELPEVAAVALQRHRHDSQPPDFSTDGRNRFPWFVSLGAYFPTFTGDGTSNSTGTELALGWRYAIDNADFRVSARGQAFNITDGFGNQSTIDVSELSFDALWRVEQFYIGPGLSFGSVTGTTDGFTFSGANQTVWQITAGYDFTTRFFAEARWQTADVDAYKGISINLGYRF